MTDHDVLLAKLENQGKLLAKQTGELSDIKKAVNEIALLNKDVSHHAMQIDALWRKYDSAMGPDGVLSSVRMFQTACPGPDIKDQIKALWAAIGLIIALIGVIKIWG